MDLYNPLSMMMRMRELDRMDLYNPLVNESWIEWICTNPVNDNWIEGDLYNSLSVTAALVHMT